MGALDLNLLADTEIFIWVASEPNRLSADVARMIADPGNQIYLSHASIWEIAIKHGIGKLNLPNDPVLWVPSRMERHRMSGLPIEMSHVFGAGRLPLYHRDPFDRLIVAQAQIEGLTLLTSDTRLAEYAVQLIMMKA